jgi:hypothetical protein
MSFRSQVDALKTFQIKFKNMPTIEEAKNPEELDRKLYDLALNQMIKECEEDGEEGSMMQPSYDRSYVDGDSEEVVLCNHYRELVRYPLTDFDY